ncbi:MAG: hypothetical protein K1X94_15450 [Sandaracinaceae bacterium]|nr:hypothetical protein [Sandaracinaceae bacterium]
MTFDEALATLGLPSGSSPDEREVRQAYVRLVKVHKPERDPERFQAIREAYERARRGRDVWERVAAQLQAASEGDGAAGPSEIASTGERTEAASARDEPTHDATHADRRESEDDGDEVEDDGDAIEHGGEEADRDDRAPGPLPEHLPPPALGGTDPVLAKIEEELDGAPDDDARLAILLRAVQAHPATSELRWELYDHYRLAHEHEAARRTLEKGVALEQPYFLEEFAHTFPADVSAAQLEQLRERGAHLLALEVLSAQGQHERSERELTTLVAQIEASGHARIPRAVFLRLGLTAMSRGDGALAARVAHLARDRPELFQASVAAQVTETYLRELLDAAPHLDREVSKCIALELLSDPRGLHPLATLRAGDPRAAARALETLERRAPILARVLGPQLGGAARDVARAGDPIPWRVLIVAIIAIMQVARMCESATPTPSTYTYDFRVPPPLPTYPERAAELAAPEVPAPIVSSTAEDRSPMSTTVDRICADAPDLCDAAMRARARAVADDCGVARREAERLEEDCGLTDARDLCRELTILVASRCEASP